MVSVDNYEDIFNVLKIVEIYSLDYDAFQNIFFKLYSLWRIHNIVFFKDFFMSTQSQIIIYMTKISYIWILLAHLTFIFACNVIVSRQIQTGYNQYGIVTTMTILFKLTIPIDQSDLLQITFPQPIHSTNNFIYYSISTETQYHIIDRSKSQAPSGSVYLLPLSSLQKDIWYQLEVELQILPITTYGLVQLNIMSGGNIIYSKNDGYGYYLIDQTTSTSQNMNISIVNTVSNLPNSLYSVQMRVNSSIASTNKTIFTISFTNTTISAGIFDYSANTYKKDFKFTGTCQIVCQNSSSNCLSFQKCMVTQQRITLVLPYINISQIFIIQFRVLNPYYVSSIGLQAFWQKQSRAIAGIGIINNALSVASIPILDSAVNLHWGIPYQTVANDMNLGIFLGNSVNSFDVGFSVSQGSPIAVGLIAKIFVGAGGIIQSSINTNLPSLSFSSKIICTYQNLYIVCRNIGPLTKMNYRYYIRAKGYFSDPTLLQEFGSVYIDTFDSRFLFVGLKRDLNITGIPSADYHDWTGIHSNSYYISDTMVVSTKDKLYSNQTDNQIFDFFTSNQTLVGIDPSVGSLSLMFLLKVGTIQMASALQPLNQTYTMEVYLNNKIMNVSDQGLDFSAFNATKKQWDIFSTPCYKNTATNYTIQTYACQRHNDHVHNKQYDNTYTSKPNYGQYKWVCGNGSVVNCTSGNCENQCNIFRGFGSSGLSGIAQGSGGVFTIRNVSFYDKQYHSPNEANQNILDFIIAFYHGSTLVSASLINAYTIESYRLKFLRASLINQYNDGVTMNDGRRTPTMIRLAGHLTLQQIPSSLYSLQLFMPSTTQVKTFTNFQNQTIGCSTNQCLGYTNIGVSISSIDNWMTMKSVKIMNYPALSEKMNMLIPVVCSGNVHSMYLALKNVTGGIISVYRLNGSATTQNITIATKLYLGQSKIPTTQMTSLDVDYWVSNSAIYNYDEKININRLESTFYWNTISMTASNLPLNKTNSQTFTVLRQNIYSTSTIVTINNNSKNCLMPFVYEYSNAASTVNYNLYVLWCEGSSLVDTINFTYPLYPTIYGKGFPLKTSFAYAYSDENGYLRGFHTETQNKASSQLCTTQKTNEYNLNSGGSQQNVFNIIFRPFYLDSINRKQFKISITFPALIPLSVSSCTANEVYQNVEFLCSFSGLSAGVNSFLLTYTGTKQVTVLQIELKVRTVRTATATITGTIPYFVKVVLPQTISGSVAAFYGTTYSPFENEIYFCNNTFTYSSISTSQLIGVQQAKVLSVTSNMLNYGKSLLDNSLQGMIDLNISFSSSRTNFFETSQLKLLFSKNIFVIGVSYCEINPLWHQWKTATYTANSITFYPKSQIESYTLLNNDYQVSCYYVRPLCSLTVNITWMDNGSLMQYSNIQSLACTAPQSATTGSMLLMEKQFNTVGYYSGYKFSYTVTVSGTQEVVISITLPSGSFYGNLLECYYLQNGITPKQIVCQYVKDHSLLINFIPVAETSLKIFVYGILSEKILTAQTIYSRISVGTSNYVYTVSDTIPSIVTKKPIIISMIDITFPDPLIFSAILKLTYRFPQSYTGNFYIEIDQYLSIQIMNSTLTCDIGGVSVTCTRITKNIIKVTNSIVHVIDISKVITIRSLTPLISTPFPVDQKQLYFKIFTINSTNNQVIFGSFMMVDNPPLVSSLYTSTTMNLLHWSINTLTSAHTIYLGYYGPSVSILPPDTFVEQFLLTCNSTICNGLSLLDTSSKLGFTNAQIYIAGLYNYSTTSLTRGFHYLQFRHVSLNYNQIELLPIYFSIKKCLITAQYPSYDIFSGGLSLPIKLNFSLCRPIFSMNLSYSFNSSKIYPDQTLTNFHVNSSQFLVFVVLRHSPETVTTGTTYLMNFTLSGSSSSYYQTIQPITIKVVSRSTIVGNPEGKDPVLNSFSDQYANFTLQCNQPSTIYWSISYYPTVLGIVSEQIQTRLVEGQTGLVYQSTDPYDWSATQFGMQYSIQSNINVTKIVTSLQGNQNYVFKYYCVNQLGKSSGGKIYQFSTPTTLYSLVKIVLFYNDSLTYKQGNLLACSISETLAVPYSSTYTSTFSNCFNTSDIFYAENTSYVDEIVNSSFTYNFYVKTTSKTVESIQNILISSFKNHNIFQSKIVPLYSKFLLNALSNANEPSVNITKVTVNSTAITLQFYIGAVNGYLIAAIMNQHFDQTTMSIPEHYFIKKGFFSQGTKFDKVYMLYGRSNITISFTQLTSKQQYSIFYFSTVDDSGLNSRHSQVQYKDMTTPALRSIDLWSYMEISCWIFAIIVSTVIF